MKYPEFIKKNDIIGVTAPSNGITKKEKIFRLESAHKKVKEIGFNTKETNNVRKNNMGASSTPKERANELLNLINDDSIKTIICATGGDFLLEILPFLDFEAIKENPKWIQGYSDPTNLLFTITTNLDIATIYSNNFVSFGMNPWHSSLYNNIEILKGNIKEQLSFEKYESEYQEYIKGDEPYLLTKEVYWKNLNNEKEINITGRIIGGCIDCLNDLFGTRFDKTKEFIKKYKDDGIIWYFDNCELSSEQLIRTLWKFKDNGWFENCNGIIFGRSAAEKSYYDISFETAIKYALNKLNIPIIINADIGHVSPQMTIINGSIAKVTSKDGKGTINFELR